MSVDCVDYRNADMWRYAKRRIWKGYWLHHADGCARYRSGLAAVLMVNIVIGFYILSAFMEEEEKEVVPPVGRFAKKNQ
jgi:hypothetical protein